MLKLSIAVGIIGAVALAACGESNETTGFGGGASGTDGGNAAGGAAAGASGGGNTSMAGAGGGSTAGAGGGSTAGAGGGSTAGAGGGSTAGAGGGGKGGANGNGGGGGAAGSTGNGGASGDGGLSCVRGVECTGFPATWVRGCTNDDSCVGEVHQTDCCGALQVMGMNHSEAATFCPAERTDCRSQYPTPPGCTSDKVVTDTGNTGSINNVATRCADINQGVGTCTTFVCGTSATPACPSARRIGNCG